MSNLVYSIAKGNLNTVDWTGAGKFRVLLATTTYVPADSHQFVSNVTNEATGTGYVRKLLAGRVRTAVGANIEYRAASPLWTTITSAFRYAIVYFDVNGSDASDATAWLVCCIDLGGTQTLTAANFVLDFNGVDPGAVFEVD